MSGTRRGKTQPFAVEKYGVEDFVLKLYKDRTPATQISKILEREKGIQIAPLGINRWLKKQRDTDSRELEVKSKEKYDVMVMDYNAEIINILNEVKELKDLTKSEKDLKYYDKLIGRLYQGIELLAKLRGDVKQQKTLDINVIINEINDRIVEEYRQKRRSIHTQDDIIDVEAEIIEGDKEKEQQLRFKKKTED